MSTALVTPAKTATSAMEVVVNRDNLLAELSAVQPISSTKTTVPILANVLLEATEGQLAITATNLEQSLSTSTTAAVKAAGSVTVPARKFFDYVRLLPAGDIRIKMGDNGWVNLAAGRSRTKMVGRAPDDYPQVATPNSANVTKIPVTAMRALIARTSFAVSTEAARHILNGALFLIEKDGFSMVATDGHRLALVKNTQQVEGLKTAVKALIPAKALADLQSLLATTQAETLDFAEDDSAFFFTIGHRAYSTRKLTGQFPNYAAVIPQNTLVRVILSTSEVEKSLRRVAQFTEEKSRAVRLVLNQNLLKLYSSSVDSGESEDVIETPYAGGELKTGLNATYLLDYCKAVGGVGEFSFQLKDSTSAVMLEPEGEDASYSFKYVIMPVRV